MSVLAVVIATPVAIFALDKLLCQGEFTLLLLEAINERRRSRLARRPRGKRA